MGRLEARKYLTLDWEAPLDYADPETNFLLSDMFYSEQERFYGRRTIDTRLLYFDYYWIDYKEAARRGKIITKSVDSRRSYSYDSLQNVSSANADGNLYSRSRRDPLSKDYKRDDLHSKTLSFQQIRKKISKYDDKKYQPYHDLLNDYKNKYRWLK